MGGGTWRGKWKGEGRGEGMVGDLKWYTIVYNVRLMTHGGEVKGGG